MEEIWKPIPGWEGIYEASNYGQIKSIERVVATNTVNQYRTVRERIMKIQTTKDGYKLVSLKHKNKRFSATVHNLVMMSFVGPRPEGLCICHNNGIPSDNRLDNLRYDTPSSNTQDKWLHGTMRFGDQSLNTKINKEIVALIFEMREANWKLLNIAKFVGVGRTLISNVLSGKRWAHLGFEPLPFKAVRN